jgi:hypothetical protein
MDGQRIDRLARALTREMSRRGAMKGVAVALGLLGAEARGSTRAAKPTWSWCIYFTSSCNTFGFDRCVRGVCPNPVEVRAVIYTVCSSRSNLTSRKACNELLLP